MDVFTTQFPGIRKSRSETELHWRTWLPALLLFALGTNVLGSDSGRSGETVYRYYCYQCHGYSGDGNTLASAYLDPPPRDFTAREAHTLSIEYMVSAVSTGRAGTGMPGFSTVLSEAEITAVVRYVRESFITAQPLTAKYHTEASGWANHERHASAFSFVAGSLRLDTPTSELSAAEFEGRALYLSACISCHEQNMDRPDKLIWELRAVSYPRRHFSHRQEATDFVSGASPYALHDRPAVPDNMSEQQQRGMSLYRENCALCHAADGTGQNWIGSFLQPRPRNFTVEKFELLQNPDGLRNIVQDGIRDSSMPAWRNVLTNQQIDDLIAYMQAAFTAGKTF